MARLILDNTSDETALAGNDIIKTKVFYLAHLCTSNSECPVNSFAAIVAFTFEGALELAKRRISNHMVDNFTSITTEVYLSHMFTISGFDNMRGIVATGLDGYGKKVVEEYILMHD